MNIKFIESPFKSKRLKDIKCIVIHHTGSVAGKLSSVDGLVNWFTSPRDYQKVSCHYLVPRDRYTGKYGTDVDVFQFVKNEDVSWHAGRSSWIFNGIRISGLNQYSIGIELQADGNKEEFDYTDFQYDKLIDLTVKLIRETNLKYCSEDEVVRLLLGHEMIAPSRKVDPGYLFDWRRYKVAVKEKLRNLNV